MLAVTPRPPRKKMEGGIGSPQPEAETLPSFCSGAGCFTFRQSCLRDCHAATSSPVGPGGLTAQPHVRARALHSPCSVTSRPARRRTVPVDGAGGIRTHGLELMRLARTAAPLPRAAPERAMSLVGRTRTCDLNVGEPMVPPRAPSFSRSNLVGRTRTCDLRRPKPVGWPNSPTTSRDCDNSPAGLEPATRGVETLCSSAELRGDRRPWNRTTLDRLIRAAPTQPARRRSLFASGIPPSGIPRSDPRLRRGRSLKASASPPQLHGIDRPSLSCRHPAGRIRTSVPHPRKVALASTELRRVERSRRESNPPHPGDSRAAQPGRVREQECVERET